ncbi:hypothetical protein ZHAS_00015949 [Anopheles sinensis]|uniref:Uncharacterized protein n=1 Tax=Anopheles sinensis TaxID=74873 RepID=A0A084WCE8_ANOSI|nr:hypothetical protein ZHAS_00015949 [Anopheles sinensis]
MENRQHPKPAIVIVRPIGAIVRWNVDDSRLRRHHRYVDLAIAGGNDKAGELNFSTGRRAGPVQPN